jgi:hypothetical protein
MPTYQTPSSFRLRLASEAGLYRVTLEDFRASLLVKILYQDTNRRGAAEVYLDEKRHYQGRTPWQLTLIEFLHFLRNGHLDESPKALAEILGRVDSEDRVEATREALEWVKRLWMADGAWEAIELIPPLLQGYRRPSAPRFFDLSEPDVKRMGHVRTKARNFWDWQREAVSRISDKQRPIRDVAREKWRNKCSNDRELTSALAELTALYITFVRLAAEERPDGSYTLEQERLRNETPINKPVCGHLQFIEPCKQCQSDDLVAYEAHYGWTTAQQWEPRNANFKDWRKHEPPCGCCLQSHDLTPIGEVSCSLCARAMFWIRSEVLARRWGGWAWVSQGLRDAARGDAWHADSDMEKLERQAGLLDESSGHEGRRAWLAKLGGSPWQHGFDEDWPMPRELATFIIPVPMFETDFKIDIKQRLLNRFDELWTRLKLSNPKSSGKTLSRGVAWDRYIDWLWLNRVEGVSAEEIALDTSSPRGLEDPLTTRAVQNGINLALKMLS